MSSLFGIRGSHSSRFARVVDRTAGDRGQSGRYLTDGLTLYRYVGRVTSGVGEMVELEDCRSLELTWLSMAQLRRLRAVVPAPAPSSSGSEPRQHRPDSSRTLAASAGCLGVGWARSSSG